MVSKYAYLAFKCDAINVELRRNEVVVIADHLHWISICMQKTTKIHREREQCEVASMNWSEDPKLESDTIEWNSANFIGYPSVCTQEKEYGTVILDRWFYNWS